MDKCNDMKSLNNYFSVQWEPQQRATRLGIVGRPKGVRRVLESSASHLSVLGSGTLARRLGSSFSPKWLEPRRTSSLYNEVFQLLRNFRVRVVAQ